MMQRLGSHVTPTAVFNELAAEIDAAETSDPFSPKVPH